MNGNNQNLGISNGINNNNVKTEHVSPPPRLPVVISKAKEAYQFWLKLQRDIPKTERFGIGQKIDHLFLEILELSFASSYLPPEQKVIALGKTISRLDILKFFIQLAWENKLVPTDKYAELSKKLEEIGRMFGGWRKGLQQKLPPR